MSVALKAILAAMASERELIADAYVQIAAAAPISQVGVITVPTANTNCLVDAINRVKDPQGRGGLLNWSANVGTLALVQGNRFDITIVYGLGSVVTYRHNSYQSLEANNVGSQPDVNPAVWELLGASTAPNAPAGWEPGNGDASYVGLSASAVGTYLQVSVDPAVDTFPAGTDFWTYVYVACESAATVAAVGSSGAVYDSQALSASMGWMMVPLSGTTAKQESVAIRLTLEAAYTPSSSKDFSLAMTGATLVTEKDPEGPFSGNYSDEPAFAYRWAGARNQSRTTRYGRQFDVVALSEQQSGLSLAPLGLSVEQRALFLRQRFLARHQPAGQVFAQLILELLQTEDPTLLQSVVHVQRNATSIAGNNGLPPRSFAVVIDYTPSAALQQRLIFEIGQTAPLHLAFEGVTYGSLAPALTAVDGGGARSSENQVTDGGGARSSENQSEDGGSSSNA
jgi:hypothetical protein